MVALNQRDGLCGNVRKFLPWRRPHVTQSFFALATARANVMLHRSGG